MSEPGDRAAALEQWHRQHGGFLHADLRIAHSVAAGYHWRANAPVESGTLILSVPHSLALSYLNALVDEQYPFFKQFRTSFGGVEAIGFWYLMLQWTHRKTSFWRPYLDTLPSPDSELTTPLFFDSDEDLAWLEGTDVLHSARQRLDIYEKQYAQGLKIMRSAGLATTPYTWHLYKWAVTMFTSRSFSSRMIRPAESKYWTAYRTNRDGQRQVVLLDMSRTPAEDLDFPVLCPTMDAGNHDPKAPVDWLYDAGRFSVTTGQAYAADKEVFNNYSVLKSNGELLLGYGFSIPNNEADVVMLTLKPPSAQLQEYLRVVHPGYFSQNGLWNSDKATFYLKRCNASLLIDDRAMTELPEPLVELLLYMLREDRDLPFQFLEQPLEYMTASGSPGRRYLPHLARAVVQSIAPKLQNMQSINLPSQPQNAKQHYASQYRQGQMDILSNTITSLRKYTRSYIRTSESIGPRLVTLELLLDIWSCRTEHDTVDLFLDGISASAGSSDIATLRDAGWEDDILILALCCIVLDGSRGRPLAPWIREMVPEYVDIGDILQERSVTDSDPSHSKSSPDDLLGIVRQAAAANNAKECFWRDPRWSSRLILDFGAKMLQFESMTMMMPDAGGENTEEPRTVIYLHAD